MVPRRAKDPAFIARFQDIVPKEVDRVNAIMEELLELSRPPRISPRPLHVHEVIARCVALYEQQAAERGITIVQELAPGLAQIRADPEYLSRAVGNLAINAIQAMTAGGRLIIRTGSGVPWQSTLGETTAHIDLGAAADTAQSFVFIALADTGTGMTPEQLDSLFTPFFHHQRKRHRPRPRPDAQDYRGTPGASACGEPIRCWVHIYHSLTHLHCKLKSCPRSS
jgi:signal transduction histidine kinase